MKINSIPVKWFNLIKVLKISSLQLKNSPKNNKNPNIPKIINQIYHSGVFFWFTFHQKNKIHNNQII